MISKSILAALVVSLFTVPLIHGLRREAMPTKVVAVQWTMDRQYGDHPYIADISLSSDGHWEVNDWHQVELCAADDADTFAIPYICKYLVREKWWLVHRGYAQP